MQGAQLAQACLSFDFVGTLLDDSAEDVTTIQVPSSWRATVEDPATLALFFDVYAKSTPPLSSTALECLVRALAAAREEGEECGQAVGWRRRRVLSCVRRRRRRTEPLSNLYTKRAPNEQVKLASVRRSLFSSEAERSKFLNRLVSGTRDVLASKRGLSEHANYHEFCRLLGRLKTNYQLSELVRLK